MSVLYNALVRASKACETLHNDPLPVPLDQIRQRLRCLQGR